MRRAAATVGALAAVVVAGALGTGAVQAETGGAAAPSTAQWLAPERLEDANGRLKRAADVRPVPALRANGWRRPATATELSARPQAWRTRVLRPPAAPQRRLDGAKADYDRAIVEATNDVRARRGLPRLRLSERLEAAAAKHSRSMSRQGFFAHESADGSAFWKRVEVFYPSRGSSYWAVGENLIWSSPELSVADAIEGWMDSPGHRDNMLSRDWREVGCASAQLGSAPGVYEGRTVVIVTCDFGIRR
jgi:uncharacterized protein YkwD